MSNVRPKKSRRDSKTGLKGAHSDGRGKFSSRIMINGKRKSLGHFCTPEEASQKYIQTCADLGLFPVN